MQMFLRKFESSLPIAFIKKDITTRNSVFIADAIQWPLNSILTHFQLKCSFQLSESKSTCTFVGMIKWRESGASLVERASSDVLFTRACEWSLSAIMTHPTDIAWSCPLIWRYSAVNTWKFPRDHPSWSFQFVSLANMKRCAVPNKIMSGIPEFQKLYDALIMEGPPLELTELSATKKRTNRTYRKKDKRQSAEEPSATAEVALCLTSIL